VSADLDAIRARWAAATPGPWFIDAASTDAYVIHNPYLDESDHVAAELLSCTQDTADAIASAHSDVAALITEVESLRDMHARITTRMLAEHETEIEALRNDHVRMMAAFMEGKKRAIENLRARAEDYEIPQGVAHVMEEVADEWDRDTLYPSAEERAASEAIDEADASIAQAVRSLGLGDAVIVDGVRIVPEAWVTDARKRAIANLRDRAAGEATTVAPTLRAIADEWEREI
jgi:hypothetical protein